MEAVLYKRIPEQPMYFASQYGDVFSLRRGKFLKPQFDKDGYVIFAFSKKKLKQHRIVYKLHFGEIANGLFVNHKDMNKSNNKISNLEVVTASENTRHSIKNQINGKSKVMGEGHYRAILTEENAKQIILENPTKYSHQKELAKRFGISDSLVRDIVKGRAWKHIPRTAAREPLE